jgi:hypothetical protein
MNEREREKNSQPNQKYFRMLQLDAVRLIPSQHTKKSEREKFINASEKIFASVS